MVRFPECPIIFLFVMSIPASTNILRIYVSSLLTPMFCLVRTSVNIKRSFLSILYGHLSSRKLFHDLNYFFSGVKAISSPFFSAKDTISRGFQGAKTQNFSGAAPLNPPGGLTAPPRPPAVRDGTTCRPSQPLRGLEKQGRNKHSRFEGGGRNKGFWPKYTPLA